MWATPSWPHSHRGTLCESSPRAGRGAGPGLCAGWSSGSFRRAFCLFSAAPTPLHPYPARESAAGIGAIRCDPRLEGRLCWLKAPPVLPGLFLLLDVLGVCLLEEGAVWSTQTGPRMCGDPCGAEWVRRAGAPCPVPSSASGPQGLGASPPPPPRHTHTSGFSQCTPHMPSSLLHSGCKMGTENPKAEPSHGFPLPGLLRARRGHPAPERAALTLVSPTRLCCLPASSL